jgi:MFS family permease
MEMWHAMVLLTLHGFAGVLWGPAGQLLVYDIVGAAQLQSAVRLSSTARMLGMLMGPAIGGGLMLAFGPPHGILVNALFYMPFMLWLFWAPFNRKHEENKRPAARGLADIVPTIREIAGNRTIVAMTLLAGGASLFIGNAYQAQMPGFAHDLGAGHADFTYSMLLAADAAGALVAGFVLESRGLLNARPRTAFILAMLWCCTIGGFAASTSYALAIVLLFFSGFLQLSFASMAQTLVQMEAPTHMRGRVIGLYAMSSQGLRAFAGVTVGLLGWALKALIGALAGARIRAVAATAAAHGALPALLLGVLWSAALAAAAAWPVYAIAPQAAGAGVAEVMAYLNGCVVPKVRKMKEGARNQKALLVLSSAPCQPPLFPLSVFKTDLQSPHPGRQIRFLRLRRGGRPARRP